MSLDRSLAIRRSRKARVDLTDIFLYVAERDEIAAKRVLKEIERVCRLIGSRPKMGRERPDLKPNIRSFVVMSWIIFYRVDDDFVEIVRVPHSARDLDAIEF